MGRRHVKIAVTTKHSVLKLEMVSAVNGMKTNVGLQLVQIFAPQRDCISVRMFSCEQSKLCFCLKQIGHHLYTCKF